MEQTIMEQTITERIPFRLYLVVFALLLLAVPIAFAADRDVRVAMVNQQPDPVEPGNYVEVRFKIENYGTEPVGPLTIGIEPQYPFVLPAGYQQEQRVGMLGRRQIGADTEIVSWRLLVDRDAPGGVTAVNIYLRDETSGRTFITRYEDEFFIAVRSADTILNVDSIIVDPIPVVPGQPFDLSLALRNVGDGFVKDVAVSLDLTDVPLSALGSVSEKIFSRIDGKEILSVPFTLISDVTVGVGIIQIPLELRFKDDLNQQHIQKSTFGVQLDSPLEYLVTLDSSSIRTGEQRGDVALRVSNSGLNGMRFLTVTLMPSQRYELLSSPEVYVGRVASDDFETLSYSLYMHDSAEDVPLRLRMTFRDEYNREYSVDEEVLLPLYSQEDARTYGLIEGNSKAGIIFIIILVVAGVGYYWYRKSRKKKRD